jgi:hypothetical protein
MPNINAKVPFYEKENKWNVEIYDTTGNLMFPCENEDLTPSHFVPRLSNAACVIQCGGIWIGGKGWGVTWKLIQAVVKPKEVLSVFGKCHIKLSEEDMSTIEKQDDNDADNDEPAATAVVVPVAISTHVEDSDSEDEEVVVEKPVVKVAAKPVVVAVVEKPADEKPAVKKVVKKVVSK